MLNLSGVNVFRGESQVLWDVSLALQPGERVAILGSNGAGKSTLLMAILGGLSIAEGEITFNGRRLIRHKPHESVQLGMALVPEGRRVYKEMTVHENLLMGAYAARGRPHLAETLDHVRELFPVLAKRKDQRAGTLSGGEQQMLAMGRALMSRPELLLIDELSLGLAPVITKDIFRILDRLQDTTILLIEQNVEQALKHSQRAYIMESGRITRQGDSAELMDDSDIRRAYLGL